MNIFGFYIFTINKHRFIITPWLRKKLKKLLIEKGRGYIISKVLTSEFTIENITDSRCLMDVIIKKFKYVDQDYQKLLLKYRAVFLGDILMSKNWEHDEIDLYILKLMKELEEFDFK